MNEETFKKILRIVNWWEGLRPDFTGLNDVMHARQVLSAHLFAMATDLSTARKSWAEAQVLLESKTNQLKVKFSLKTNTTQAGVQAKANTLKEFEMEKNFEAIYFGMKHQYDAIVQILEAMSQRIAILRREWETKNYSGGTV